MGRQKKEGRKAPVFFLTTIIAIIQTQGVKSLCI